MVRILQVARKRPGEPCNIHPLKWVKMLKRCWPEANQRWIHCDHGYPKEFRPDLVIIHALNQRPHLVRLARRRAPKAKIVGISYNSLWLTDPTTALAENLGSAETAQAFLDCDLILGRVADKNQLSPGLRAKWVQMGHLIDEEIFRPLTVANKIDVFVPRGGNGKPVYWTRERAAALVDFPGTVVHASGRCGEVEMAQLYNQARCVLALREDSGPAYSVVEAALCGNIPIVSDHPPIMEHFPVGAIPAQRDPGSIRKAVEAALALSSTQRAAWVQRNLDYFQGWTMTAQGTRLVRHLKGLL